MQANGVHTLSKYQRLNELREIGRWFDPNRRSHSQSHDPQRVRAFLLRGKLLDFSGCRHACKAALVGECVCDFKKLIPGGLVLEHGAVM
jgi:hypothetical protein